MRSKRILPAAILSLVLPLARGEDFWTKKPYAHWSAEETRRMLQDSPWARTVSVSTALMNMPRIEGNIGNAKDYESEAVTDPTITYTLQFRSAAPIREAQVRSSQFSSHYDAMNAEKKAAFDANAGKFLGRHFPRPRCVRYFPQQRAQL